MLKMKIDPAMCMITHATVTTFLVKNTAFTRKCAQSTPVDKIQRDFVAEQAQISR